MLFASGGHEVRMYDIIPEALEASYREIKITLVNLEKKGQLKGSDKRNAAQQADLIKIFHNLKDAVTGATYIQECTPENLEMKKAVYVELNNTLKSVNNSKAILGSSSSTLAASKFTTGLEISKRCLVVHPINPPYFIRLVELSPSPVTDPAVTAQVKEMLIALGHKPIVLNKEVAGFALNRLQYAILNEVWRLVNDGVLSAEDADLVMKEGLAPRYVFLGPLETAQLNANGFVDYCARYGQGIFEVSETQVPIPRMTTEGAKEIDRQLQTVLPDSKLGEKREWRDQNLAQLAAFKSKLGL
jgi:L-gulonate 3-dehydrogenase